MTPETLATTPRSGPCIPARRVRTLQYMTQWESLVTRVPITLRLDPKLRAALAAAAEREDRTMTAIVERALRAYFKKEKP